MEFVKESPAICPLSLMSRPNESGPPSVPRSCITPLSHTKPCHAVGEEGSSRMPPKFQGSGSVFSAPPTT